jgi:thioredoxin reductase (NADPH)
MQDVDLAVVGAGVAGLVAAATAGRHGLAVAVVERLSPGGQIANAERIWNLPGFPQGIAGAELGPLLHLQAEAARAQFLLDTVEAITPDDSCFVLRGAAEQLRARAVIIAAGSSPRALGVPGEARLAGKGISHCASCDGPLFAARNICVVGGGDCALDEALELAAHAAHVTILHRGSSLDAQAHLVEQARAWCKIEIVLDTAVDEIVGDDKVTAVRLRDVRTGAARMLAADGVFIYVGTQPNSQLVRGLLDLDADGRIKTDGMMRTSVPGIFAAGDIRAGAVALLAAVAGDGAIAALSAWRHLQARSEVS